MVRRGQTLLREHEGVSSPKRRRTEVRALVLSQSVTFLSSRIYHKVKQGRQGHCFGAHSCQKRFFYLGFYDGHTL
jgi:hypothetical protein